MGFIGLMDSCPLPTTWIPFDEVTWPPPATNSRVGGYSFLGGEAEVPEPETLSPWGFRLGGMRASSMKYI